MRSADRTATLFDLGLGLKNADFCVRTDDAELIEFLGAHAGEQLLDGGHDVIAKLVEHDPHRVVLTGSARAEIYQPIAREKTPEGPHTHLLPRLIATGRTPSDNVPVTAGMRPCFTLHPRHPLFDALGERRSHSPTSSPDAGTTRRRPTRRSRSAACARSPGRWAASR